MADMCQYGGRVHYKLRQGDLLGLDLSYKPERYLETPFDYEDPRCLMS